MEEGEREGGKEVGGENDAAGLPKEQVAHHHMGAERRSTGPVGIFAAGVCHNYSIAITRGEEKIFDV